MSAFSELVEKATARALDGYVRKDNPGLQGVWRVENLDVQIPRLPAGANLGTAGEAKQVWVAQTAPVPLPPGLNQLPQTPVQSQPAGASTFGSPGVWVYSPAAPAVVDDKGEAPKGQVVQEGDLVSFTGPGGVTFSAPVTMVVRDRVIAQIGGQVIALPSSSLAPFDGAGGPGGNATEVVHKSVPRTTNALAELANANRLGLPDGVRADILKRALGEPATDDDSGNPAPGYNDGTPAGGATVVDGPPYEPGPSEPGTPVQGHLSEAEMMLVNSALEAYGPTDFMPIDQEGPDADEYPTVDKALKAAAFNRPGIAAQIAAVRAKLRS